VSVFSLVRKIKTFLLATRLSPQSAGADMKTNKMIDYSKTEDETLMVMFSKHSNIRAFEMLLKRYRNQVFGFFVQGCRDRDLAEDLYQETFIRVVRSAGKYKPKATFRTWIFRIARNLLIDSYRHRSVRGEHISYQASDTTALDQASAKHNPGQNNPQKAILAQELGDKISHIIQNLPADQREMFLLREEVGLDYREASRIAGCSINTAKSRMRYALLKLRDELTRLGLQPEGMKTS